MTSLPRLTIPYQTSLEILSETDIMPVFRATHKIWSAGLSGSDYLAYNVRQRQSVWGKKNLSLIGIKNQSGQVVTSCKLYKLTVQSRAIEHRLWGLGAVFTRVDCRGQGLASDLIEGVVELALQEDIDGLLLFSDIGADFYNSHGFYPCGGASFTLHLPANTTISDSPNYEVSALAQCDVDFLQRHYQRWLSRQPFGVQRDESYWHYKIAKESYLATKSRLSWPALLALIIPGSGYAILEKGGATLRVLEIIADNPGPLWHAILDYAIKSQARRLRGWEGVLSKLAPSFALDRYLKNHFVKDGALKLEFSERTWGSPMIMPLTNTVEDWLDNNPCPLLELDHL